MCNFIKPTQELGQNGVTILRFGIADAFKILIYSREL